jgi:hypothetical protein
MESEQKEMYKYNGKKRKIYLERGKKYEKSMFIVTAGLTSSLRIRTCARLSSP